MLSLEVLERVRAGFLARQSGFLSLNSWLAQKKINRERKQDSTRLHVSRKKMAFGRLASTKSPGHRKSSVWLRLGHISVQFVPEWPQKCGPNCRLWPKFNFILWSVHAANSKECQKCSFPLKFEFTCEKSPPLSSRGETLFATNFALEGSRAVSLVLIGTQTNYKMEGGR